MVKQLSLSLGAQGRQIEICRRCLDRMVLSVMMVHPMLNDPHRIAISLSFVAAERFIGLSVHLPGSEGSCKSLVERGNEIERTVNLTCDIKAF